MKRISLALAMFFITLFTGCEFGMTDYIDELTQPTTFFVIYDANGAESGLPPTDSTEYKDGYTVTVKGNEGNLVKTGVNFCGWDFQAVGGTTYTQGQTFIIGKDPVRLYARWTANPVYYITYSVNGGSGVAPVDLSGYEAGRDVVMPEPGSMAKDGYSFTGWNRNSSGDGDNFTPRSLFTMGSENVTLYANWYSGTTYSVLYADNNPEPSVNFTGGLLPVDGTDYRYNATVTVCANTGNLTHPHYTLTGWNTASNGSGTARSFNSTFTMPESNVLLYGVWAAKTYTVTFNCMGGTGAATGTVTYNSTYGTLPVPAPGESGVHFGGWFDNAACTGTEITSSTKVTNGADHTLYAKWIANTGGADTTFGEGDGIVTTEINATYGGFATDLVFQSDGRIILTGTRGSSTGADPVDFALVRYTTAGIIDTTFGTGGIVIQDMGTDFNHCKGAAMQGDKIIAAGQIWNEPNSTNPVYYNFGAVRYNSNGTTDDTFGINKDPANLTTVNVTANSNDRCYATAVQDDGKVLLAGGTEGTAKFTIVRLSLDGVVDTDFGTSGIVEQPIFEKAWINSIIVHPDKKIVAAGAAEKDGRRYIALARFEENGGLDTSFGSGGIITPQVGTTGDAGARAVVLQGDKIIVAGWTNCNGTDDFVLIRYNSNGIPDDTFGTNGMVITDRGINKQNVLNAAALLPDGRIIGAGYSSNGTYKQFTVVCYTADGKLDTTFGGNGNGAPNGFVIPFAGESVAEAVAVRNGKIFAGGSIKMAENKFDFALTCFIP